MRIVSPSFKSFGRVGAALTITVQFWIERIRSLPLSDFVFFGPIGTRLKSSLKQSWDCGKSKIKGLSINYCATTSKQKSELRQLLHFARDLKFRIGRKGCAWIFGSLR